MILETITLTNRVEIQTNMSAMGTSVIVSVSEKLMKAIAKHAIVNNIFVSVTVKHILTNSVTIT